MGFKSLSPAKLTEENKMKDSLELQIRLHALAARKAGRRQEANLLTTLLADAQIRAKNEQRAVTDADLLAALRYFVKNLERSIAAQPTADAQAEVELLQRYLPVETLPTVEEAIDQVLAANPSLPVKRLVGLVMRARKGSANPALVEEQLAERLASQ